MTKLIILDRDGVINYDSLDYIKSVDEFHLIPGSLDAIAKLTRAGYQVAVATNQSGIARGYYNHEGLEAIHDYLLNEVKQAGGQIDLIKYCPHMPDSGCTHRKPAPGMLEDVAQYFGVSLGNVPFVGDRVTDILAANAVGAKPYIIQSSMTDMDALANHPDVPCFQSLQSCVEAILAK